MKEFTINDFNINLFDFLLFVAKEKLVLKFVHIAFQSIPPEMFLGKNVMKICSKFTGEHQCQSVISIKLLNCTAAWLWVF